MRVIETLRRVADAVVDAAGRWFNTAPPPMVGEPHDDEHERAKERARAIMRKHERLKRGWL